MEEAARVLKRPKSEGVLGGQEEEEREGQRVTRASARRRKQAQSKEHKKQEDTSMAMTSAARRHILITGSPGTGKSTLVSKLIARFKDKGVPMQGFWTKEVRQGGNRIGFDVVTLDGKEGVLSRVGAKGPRVGKYGVNVKEFEELALPCLRAGPVQKQEQGGEEAGQQGRQRQAVRLVVVDEIGKMELFSQPFMTAYKGLLDSAADRGVVVVSTIAKRGQGFIAEVKSRPDVDLHEITRANRDAKFEELASTLLRQLRPSS